MTELERLELILRDFNTDNPELTLKAFIQTLIKELQFMNEHQSSFERERLTELRGQENR